MREVRWEILSIFHFYSYKSYIFCEFVIGTPGFFLFNFVISNIWQCFPKTLAKLVEVFLKNFFPQNYPNSLVNFYFILNVTQKKKKKKKGTLCQLIFFHLCDIQRFPNFLGQIYNKKTQFYPKTFQMFLVKRMRAFVPKKNTTVSQILIFTK
jgi:hypothetical protein